MDDEVVSRDLVPAFVKLLKDTEAEVRSAIAGQIPGKIPFCFFLTGEMVVLLWWNQHLVHFGLILTKYRILLSSRRSSPTP